MITKYKIFEAKFGNLSRIISKNIDSELYKQMMDYKSDFKFDEEPIDGVYLPQYNINMKIIWYNNKHHIISKRVKERTQLYSMSEFNNLVTKSIIYLFDNYFYKIKQGDNKYDLYLSDTNIHILISINYSKIFEDYPYMNIITILPQEGVKYSDLLEIPY